MGRREVPFERQLERRGAEKRGGIALFRVLRLAYALWFTLFDRPARVASSVGAHASAGSCEFGSHGRG